jgi:hypothetical protein
VNINDKHIETIVRQMMRWVKVEDVGDTTFLLEEQVDKFRFREENDRVISEGGRPATGRPLLLGITKASLSRFLALFCAMRSRNRRSACSQQKWRLHSLGLRRGYRCRTL